MSKPKGENWADDESDDDEHNVAIPPISSDANQEVMEDDSDEDSDDDVDDNEKGVEIDFGNGDDEVVHVTPPEITDNGAPYKAFVGRYRHSTTTADLDRFFARGKCNVLSKQMISKETGGYCIVEFADFDSFSDALIYGNGEFLNGKRLKISAWVQNKDGRQSRTNNQQCDEVLPEIRDCGPPYKTHVRNFEYDTTEAQLHHFFERGQCEIISLELIRDKDGNSRFAIVEFKAFPDYQKTLQRKNGMKLGRRPLKIAPWDRSKDERKPTPQKVKAPVVPEIPDPGSPYKLHVSNFEYDTSEASLSQFFQLYSLGIMYVEIIHDRNGDSMGFAMVEFDDFTSYKGALQRTQGQKLSKRPLKLARWDGKQASTPSPQSGNVQLSQPDDFSSRLPPYAARIKQLSEITSEQDVLTFFERGACRVSTVTIIRDSRGRSRCRSVVEFEDYRSLFWAVKAASGRKLNGEKVKIDLYDREQERLRQKQQEQQRGWGRGRKDTGHDSSDAGSTIGSEGYHKQPHSRGPPPTTRGPPPKKSGGGPTAPAGGATGSVAGRARDNAAASAATVKLAQTKKGATKQQQSQKQPNGGAQQSLGGGYYCETLPPGVATQLSLGGGYYDETLPPGGAASAEITAVTAVAAEANKSSDARKGTANVPFRLLGQALKPLKSRDGQAAAAASSGT